ncbi:Re/Si-specific NAD(P)(+) transhydrogenase subunit alpha [Amycolatopsis rubida]|uniref:NAD(P) transhydrogenase subunit alpha n=1 Tax=Amycolatopsis rubida TaxID=112413 RepID=A0A1I5LFB2_9PSEU|nr:MULTISPECIES: Re/Si-specific NAD(P)(+) transhydrogenase subunit alpha [Amycolatopsis]MYW93869.1 Re/Si-specific NAD(P)(+) transhydrogenase subunit alpha [Amycolatopsis rubida]NEC58858.1 Re/Si-specific NAD(P)(+) transhydrogenase subunit alpha [Amycolatopsis rubida]OAP25362.1 NAD(P) transhydrogenase subunit alpha [Amycolatopsis sp. M39]SFO96059.1 NAD(P) transhydrogenase subunit alpha [Amycolatopsis rubida]
MLIGVLKEAQPGETRVAATPETVGKLRGLGYEVAVEPGAGLASGFFDQAYADAGAAVGSIVEADIVFGVNAPSSEQLDAVKSGATVVSLLAPALKPELVEDVAKRPITALAMDAVPRISRAQSLDVLSSMANIAGYRAVVEAAHTFGRFFTGQVTAAGKVNPAKVLVVGAGVAGLAAIGAAGSLGAIVRATDPRPEVADQVKSLGGEYLSIEDPNAEVSATGYAKEMGDDYKAREKELYATQCEDVDIIVTTALIPGRPAPRIITGEMVASMKPGSVIVDMAAVNGGNVEGSVAGESIVTDNGVTILGYTDLAGRLPAQASQLYGTNLVNLMKLMTPEKDGQLVVDFDDVVVRSITVVKGGELTWPPPPVQVSAAPQKPAAAPEKKEEPEKQPMSPGRRLGLVLGVAAVFLLLAALAPAALLPHLTVFALAIVIGYYVIGHVHHALHTPLMSVTNAISGIIVVGALLNLVSGNTVVVVLAAVATLLATINIFGGFAVTRRMLAMFSRS